MITSIINRQNEKTMDALQSDIDILENEKTDLKKKLEIYAKKSKLDFSALSQPSAAMASIVCKLNITFTLIFTIKLLYVHFFSCYHDFSFY